MVTEAIRSAIINGDFAPNQRLVEMDVARQFGVGRAVVRAAFLELAKEGLVEREPQKGAVVRAVSLAEAIEIAEVRRVVEGLCAGRAAERATAAQVRALRKTTAGMRRAVRSGDLYGYTELNYRLHLQVHETSQHATAAAIATNLRNQSAQYQLRFGLLPGRPASSLAEHEAVVEAIAARDPARAERLMQAHLRNVVEALRSSGRRDGSRVNGVRV